MPDKSGPNTSGPVRSGTRSRGGVVKPLAVVTGLALAGVIGVGGVVGSEATADSLEPRAREALDAAGLTDVEVEFEGREAEVSNGSIQDLQRAEDVVEGVDGVRWATIDRDSSDDDDDERAVRVALEREGNELRIDGTVPDASTAARLKSSAADAFGVPVVGDLEIDDSLQAPSWGNQLAGTFGDMAAIKDLDLDLEGTTLELGGSIESEAGRDKVVDLIGAAMPDVTIEDDLDIEAGGLSADDAETLNGATLYFARGGSDLSTESIGQLDDVATVLQDNPDVVIEAGGHAGPTNPDAGARLSQQRVDAVKDYLVQAGIDASRVQTKSYGSDQQTGADPYAKQYRRVDFVVKEN